jgi:ATP/ADP translocase
MAENLTKSQQIEIKKEVNKQVHKAEIQIEKEIKKKFHKRLLSRTKEKSIILHSKFKEQASTALIAAFGFLIALVWRDLIVKAVKEAVKIESMNKYPYLVELYTAIVVTIVAILGISLISRWAQKPN